MLWTICVILLILWLLGLISGYTMGGVVHILLVIAIVVVLVRVIQGRRPCSRFDPCRRRSGVWKGDGQQVLSQAHEPIVFHFGFFSKGAIVRDRPWNP